MRILVTSSRSWPRYFSGARGLDDPLSVPAGLWVPLELAPASGRCCALPLAYGLDVPLAAACLSSSANMLLPTRLRFGAWVAVGLPWVFAKTTGSKASESRPCTSRSSCEARRLLPRTWLWSEDRGGRIGDREWGGRESGMVEVRWNGSSTDDAPGARGGTVR